MKRAAKRLLLPVLALTCLLTMGTGLAAANTNILSGRYLRGSNGSHIVVDSRGNPHVMEDRSEKGVLFEALEDGDRVLVLCGANVNEIYPARNSAYWCLRLGTGTQADLPGDTVRQLAELGWLTAPL